MKIYQAMILSLLGHGVLLLPSAGQPLPEIKIAPMQVTLLAGTSQSENEREAQEKPNNQRVTDQEFNRPVDRKTVSDNKNLTKQPVRIAAREAGEKMTAVDAENVTSKEMSRQQAQTRVVSRLHNELKNYFEYPRLARRNGWEGKVVLAMDIYLDGRIYNVQLKSGSGHRVLDKSALNAVSRIRSLSNVPRWQGSSPLNIALPVIYRLQG